MVKSGKFIKIVGLKFDITDGIKIVMDARAKNFIDAGVQVDGYEDENVIFVGIPCNYTSKI